MGSSQKLATVVILGIVAISTILVLILADESNRIVAEEQEQQEVAIERATQNYITLCLSCHGPAGEGYTELGAKGTGRIGAPIGGINTSLNQEGINAQGTPVAGGFDGRTKIIHTTIAQGLKNPDGSVRMPAWGVEYAGPLNNEQVDELVTMVQHVDWNVVYNEAVIASGGFPTPPPGTAAKPTEPPAPTAEGGTAGETVTIVSYDVYFEPIEITITADSDVTLMLPNEGMAPHNFSIDALDINIDLPAGTSEQVVINAPAGEYEYYCNVPGHKEAGMVGKLIVK